MGHQIAICEQAQLSAMKASPDRGAICFQSQIHPYQPNTKSVHVIHSCRYCKQPFEMTSPHHVQALVFGGLDALGRFLLIEGASAGSGLRLDELLITGLRPVEVLLEDGLGFVELELGLEVDLAVVVAAAVGAATGIGEVELIIDDLFADTTPIGRGLSA